MDFSEQTSVIVERSDQTHVISAQQILSSLNSTTSTSRPTVHTNESLTETEKEEEDHLMDLIDDLICRFLNRHNRRSSSYRSLFRWTFDPTATTADGHRRHSNLSYSVVVQIEASSSSRFI